MVADPESNIPILSSVTFGCYGPADGVIIFGDNSHSFDLHFDIRRGRVYLVREVQLDLQQSAGQNTTAALET